MGRDTLNEDIIESIQGQIETVEEKLGNLKKQISNTLDHLNSLEWAEDLAFAKLKELESDLEEYKNART